ncbi:MAG: thermonuclease family protein [Panacagrimonas sp.]
MSAVHAFATGGRSTGSLRWRHRRWFFTGALLATTFLLYAGKAHAQPDTTTQPLEGEVTVVDGDTLRFADRTVRLWGVDAPAAQQLCQLDGKPWACGDAARAALAGYVANRRVHCELVADPQAIADAVRPARCRVGHAELNSWLVQEGWALDTPTADSARAYMRLQNDAALARRGLWQGQFVEPWAWRLHDDPASTP